MVRKKSYRWKVLLALSTILICCPFIISKAVYATDESDTWIIPNNSYNDYQKTTSIKGEFIIQQGNHQKGTSNIFYRTSRYCMTLEDVSETYTKSGAFDKVDKELFNVDQSNKYNGDIVTTTYIFKKSDFLNAMINLGVTSKKIKANGGSITVYIHNEFELYNPNKEGDPAYKNYTKILGYKDLMKACEKLSGGSGFSGDTPKILKSYYNYPYVVKPTIFNVEIVAVDTEGNILGTLKSGDSGMFNETYPQGSSFTAPATYISPTGVRYTAKNYWYSEFYTRNTINGQHALIRSGDYKGRTINDYKLQDATKDEPYTFYAVYAKKPSAWVFMNAVDKADHTHILQRGIYTQDITASELFHQPDFNNPKTINEKGINYKKTVFYTYTYKRKTGSDDTKGTDTEVSGTTKYWDYPLSFQIPDDVIDNSTITVNVYYNKETLNPQDIPVTVIAVDKDTGKSLATLEDTIIKEEKTYTYTVQDSILTKTYTYTGSWEWLYTKNTSTSPIVKNKGSGAAVNFKAPKKDLVKDNITVKIYYSKVPQNTEEADITLRIILVNESGNLLKEISKKTVSKGTSISQTTTATVSVNQINYKYLNKWNYAYMSSTGTITKSGTGITAIFTIAQDTKSGSVVTLRFYYELDSSIEPNVPDPKAPISISLDSPDPEGVINGDHYDSPYFISKQGISTTESQYVYVKTKDYLLGYTLVNRTGKVTYYVPVTMHYTLQYKSATPDQYGGAKTITEEVKDTQKIKVVKTYSYWEITKLEYYYVDYADILNYSLPGGNVKLHADTTYLDIPSIATWHSDDLDYHVLEPEQVSKGIDVMAELPIISDSSVRPKIDYEDLISYAFEMTDEVKVKNDYLMFDGNVVLSNESVEKEADVPDTFCLEQCITVCKDKALYTHGKVIDAEKENGNYPSTGSVTYNLNPNSINANYSTKVFQVSVNHVIIHTPVICDPQVNADNDKWTQLLRPVDEAVQIVLDPDTSLNDFSVKISNTLQHSNRLGYYTRDFSKSFRDPENISYIANRNGILLNEMQLPFDVYIDIMDDGDAKNDQYIKAGTWIVLGRAKARLYVPLWVPEGGYTAHFRTIAVNGTDKLTMTEKTRNSERSNYVATSTQSFQISGRIYGLTIYDISDYPKWENIFRKENTMLFKLFEGAVDGTARSDFNKDYAYYYTVGTNNQYGNKTGRYSKFTFPLVNGSHPKYKNLGVQKTGYAVRFMLDTIGEMYSSGCRIKIIPTFYYVNKEGKNRQQVDLYYKEEINEVVYPIVKVGSGIDLVNIKAGKTGNIYSRIPKDELKQTAKVLGTSYSKLKNQSGAMYSYSQINLLKEFRTFIGNDYASYITGLDSFSGVSNATNQTKTSLSKYMQRWYGTYKLPTNVHAVKAGYDVYGYLKKHGIDYSEDFWLRGGYIIVNFNIITIDKDGKQNLSYINANNYLHNNNCSMWVTEGGILQKTDNKNLTFNFKAGDFLIYYTDKKSSDDYSGGLY